MRFSARSALLLAALILAIGGLALAGLAGAEDQPTVRSSGYDTDPPQTKITKGPSNTTEKAKATFKFTSSENDSTFECKLDSGPFESCDSPQKLTGLDKGKHKFKVRASDAAGNVDSTPAKDKWKIVG